jgi:hypothetical protein
MFKVIVAGSRSFSNYSLLVRKMDQLLVNKNQSEIEIVSGTARGADRLGERYAHERGLALCRFAADWEHLGRKAGLVRNEAMAKYADALVCFWDGQSPGSRHMISVAQGHGVSVRVVRFGPPSSPSSPSSPPDSETEAEEQSSEASLFIHDSRDQLRDAFENAWISREEYLTADPAAWGEGFEGMACHVSDMTNLDRMIFEDGVASVDGSVVMAPYLEFNAGPRYLQPEYLVRVVGCTFQEAVDFQAAFEVIGNSRELVEFYVSRIKEQGVEASLQYFGSLAADLAQAETMPDTEACPEFFESDAAVDPFVYHSIGVREALDWFDRAPKWFRKILEVMDACQTLAELSEFGRSWFAHEHLKGSLAGVFWTRYNIRKARLTPPVSPKAEQIIQQIGRCKRPVEIARIGKSLYQEQKASRIPPSTWSCIWAEFKARKQTLQVAA